MAVSDILRQRLANLTPQQIASMALEADQAARRARHAGDMEAADAYQREADALARLAFG